MTEQTKTAIETANALTVKTFFDAMHSQDFDVVDALLADDLVYENVGFPTLRGGRRVAKLFRGMKGKMEFEAVLHRNVPEGATVINERHDMIAFGRLHLKFWVCGVFEVHDGRITLWRDYFDTLDFFVKAPVRGLIGVVIPSLRPRL